MTRKDEAQIFAIAGPVRGRTTGEQVDVVDGTAQGDGGVKMTIRVYTVSREGVVSPPRAEVIVPYGSEPQRELLNTQLPPCRCPRHRQGGGAR